MLASPYPKLSKAPIVEAVIELRVRTTSPVEVSRLLALRDSLKSTYPKSRDLHMFAASINIDDPENVKQGVEAQHSGVRLETEDGMWVIQCKLDGLSVSRMAPYTDFDSLLDRTKRVWNLYVPAAGATAVVRLGVRYINRIELPAEPVDFDDILTAGPKIPPDMPQLFSEYFGRVVVPMLDDSATVAIVQAFGPGAPSPNAGLPGLVIDIDAVSDRTMKADAVDIWECLHTLRRVKNMAFFNSLTPSFLETLK